MAKALAVGAEETPETRTEIMVWVVVTAGRVTKSICVAINDKSSVCVTAGRVM